MKRVLASVLVAGMATVGFATTSHAGPNANAKIQIHLAAHTTKLNCTRAAATPACQGVNTAGAVNGAYDAYLIVTDGNQPAGVAGVQCGIQYPNGWFIAWTLCASLEFPSTGWPAPGGGNLITWNTATLCQRNEPGGPGTGVVADAGYFYMTAYSVGTMQVTPRPVDGVAKVADCSAVEDVVEGGGVVRTPSHLGSANFTPAGGVPGFSPCGLITPTKSTTWGAVKSIYASN